MRLVQAGVRAATATTMVSCCGGVWQRACASPRLTLMTVGLYNQPDGVWLPSVTY
jgi:hypothetical protein